MAGVASDLLVAMVVVVVGAGLGVSEVVHYKLSAMHHTVAHPYVKYPYYVSTFCSISNYGLVYHISNKRLACAHT